MRLRRRVKTTLTRSIVARGKKTFTFPFSHRKSPGKRKRKEGRRGRRRKKRPVRRRKKPVRMRR